MHKRVASLALLSLVLASLPAHAAEPPALTVMIVVDQLSAELFDRRAPTFTGGFARLMKESVRYQDARYTAVPTVTSCGHAALATGAYGSIHGVGGNDWWDRKTNTHVYCVEDARYHLLDRAPKDHDGTAPTFLTAATLADVFKAANPTSKVVALAVKDRSAILLGGKRPNAAVWYDRWGVRFGTSDFYAKKLPAWTAAENQVVAGWSAKGVEWKRTAASAAIEDAIPWEASTRGVESAFPHKIAGGLSPSEFSNRFIMNALADREVLKLAQAAVEGENLGADNVPDLLLVSLSANDYILHSYGPDSAEAAESLASIDAGLEDFLNFLDEKVGRDRVVVSLSADHGGAPAVEVAQARGLGGGRIHLKKVELALEAALNQKFGKKREWLKAFTESGIYLDDEGDVDFEAVKAEAARVLEETNGVGQVFRRGHPEQWQLTMEGKAAARGYSRANGGDLVVVLAPYWIIEGDIASHSTPYAFDARVPLFVRAPGVRPAKVARRVDPIDLPVTLAVLAGLPPPGQSEGMLLGEVTEVEERSKETATRR